MASPLVALATVGAAQAFAGAKAAEDMKRQARMQQKINEINAKYMDIDAFNVRNAGVAQAGRYETTVTQTIADQRLAMAAANVDITSGTAKELQTEARLIGDLNQIDIVEQGQMRAYGLENQARNLRLSSEFATQAAIAQADAMAERGFIQGAMTFASGYSKDMGPDKKTGHFG